MRKLRLIPDSFTINLPQDATRYDPVLGGIQISDSIAIVRLPGAIARCYTKHWWWKALIVRSFFLGHLVCEIVFYLGGSSDKSASSIKYIWWGVFWRSGKVGIDRKDGEDALWMTAGHLCCQNIHNWPTYIPHINVVRFVLEGFFSLHDVTFLKI